MKKSALLILISLLIIGAGSFAFLSLVYPNLALTFGHNSTVEGQGPKDKNTTEAARANYGPEPPTGHSKNKKIVELETTASYAGKVSASMSFDGTWLAITVEASLPDPPVGKIYELYLVKPSSKPQFFYLGKLVKENGKYVRGYYSTSEMSEYTEIMITEDNTAQPRLNEAAPRVSKGSFR